MIDAIIHIQNVGNTRVNALPIIIEILVVNKKSQNNTRKYTDNLQPRGQKVIRAICVLSPKSAIVTDANDATDGSDS